MTQDPLSAALPAAALAERLTAGAVALMPTDTLPALAARPAFASRIWELKQRPLDKPLILMGANLDQFEAVLGVPWRPEWLAMAAQGWPGPLTLVLPARGGPMDQLHPGGRSLGLRIPACAEARELLGCSGVLATTSANPSGAAAARDAEAARRFFPGLPLLGPIPWPAGSGLASTVLAWQEDGGGAAGRQGWRVLRQGAFVLPDRLPEQPMAALSLVLLITMAIYAWIASPLIIGGTVVLKALWLAWLPLLLLGWLLAGKEDP